MQPRYKKEGDSQRILRRGGAAVSLVLAWPFYIVISAIVFEIILLCINYVTVTSAVDRAATQARQWIHHRNALMNEGSDYQKQIHKEVCESLLPFVITRDRANEDSVLDGEIVRELRESGFDSRALPHYNRRWNRISQATTVKITPEETRGAFQDISIEVTYESPFWVPFIGLAMGTQSATGANYRVWQIRQSNRFTVLADQWKRTHLGIEFNPFQSAKP